MTRPGEKDLFEDWQEVKRVSGVILRYPKAVLVVTLLVTLAAVVVTLRRAPVYRSQVSLKLADESTRNPVLEDLDIPTGTTDAQDALATLPSSDTVRRIVGSPEDGEIAHPGHPEYGLRMGLETQVIDLTMGTFEGFFQRVAGMQSSDLRLFAELEPLDPRGPRVVHVRFAGAGSVAVSLPGDEASTQIVAVKPGVWFEACGVRLRLMAEGQPDMRPFMIRRLSEDDAISWVQGKLGVASVPDQDVLRLAVTDSDPRRAQEIANAMARSFLERDLEATRGRADEIVGYVKAELDGRAAELNDLNSEVARILGRYPDAVDPEQGFLQLNEMRIALENQLIAITSLRSSLSQLHENLVAGDRASASGLGKKLDDPMTRKYLDLIAVFEEERMRLGRADSGEYRKILRVKSTEADAVLRSTQASLRALETTIEALEQGDTGALGRLGAAPPRPGVVTVDAITLQYVDDYGKAVQELAELEMEFSREYYAVPLKEKQIAGIFAAILGHLRSRERAVALELEHAGELVEHWTRLLEATPQEERERIDESIESLWVSIEKAVSARLTGILQEETALAGELGDVEGRIAGLPEAKRLLREPEMNRDSLEKVVSKLIEKHEMAKVAAAGATPAVSVLTQARLPRKRLAPSLHLGLSIGLLMGLMLAVVGCLVHERHRGRMAWEADYRGLGGVPLFATLPGEDAGKTRGQKLGLGYLGSFEDPDGPRANALRQLRSRLRSIEREEKGLSTVAITSCQPGEGKTSANIGLAVAFALEGRKVLLVDANLRTPGVHEALELEFDRGLAESLDGRSHWMQCIRRSSFQRVDVLAAGDHYYAPSDLLAGPRMEECLAEWKEQYDIIVLDLPHADGLPDVTGIGPLLDAVLLLYCEETGTAKPVVEATIERLKASGTPVAGLVRQPRVTLLNRVSRRAPSKAAA